MDIFVPIVAGALQSEKQGVVGSNKLSAINQQVADGSVFIVSDKPRTDDFGDLS